MAIESISNASGAYADYSKPDQKVQPAALTGTVVPAGAETVTVSPGTKQDGTKEEDKQKGEQKANEKLLKSILNETNSKIKPQRTQCEFSYHEDINRVSIKVMDVDTKEVIREIPPEKTMEMLEKLWEVAGLLVDEKR